METFNLNPITKSELLKWKDNPTKNPRTNRKINENGNLSKFFNLEYNKHFPKDNNIICKDNNIICKEKYKLEDSIDDKDPITLNIFWKIENNQKKIVYEDINNLFLYKDTNGFIRCFEKESLGYMKAHKITKHPVTQEEIPNNILNSVEEINLSPMSIEDKAFEIFQKFTNISIFIDSNWFLSLSKDELKKFHFELNSFYKENFNKTQQEYIGTNVLSKKDNHIKSMNLKEFQLYLLCEMDKFLSVKVEELKYMCNYILIGALGLVIPEINELYPDFSFSF